jgi:Mu-like prophage protein Com
MARNCGECLMTAVEMVALDVTGKCPRCGADYGPDPQATAPDRSRPQTDRQTAPDDAGRDRRRRPGR